MLGAGMISPEDLELYRLTDDPVEAADLVIGRYELRT